MPRSPPAIGEAVNVSTSVDLLAMRKLEMQEHTTGEKLMRKAERQEMDQISLRHMITASDLGQTTYPTRQPQGRTAIVQQHLIHLVLDQPSLSFEDFPVIIL